MRHTLYALLLAATAVLTGAPGARAEMVQTGPAWRPPAVAGIYLSAANQGYCSVIPRPDGYLFVDEFGGQALFAFTGTNRLEVVATVSADPNIVATVGRDELGRRTIRFDAPGQAPAFWVLAR